MFKIVDWNTRKQEISATFRMATLLKPLPEERDTVAYASLLNQMDIVSVQDFAILYNIVEDAIMIARREERPTKPLEMFKDWLQRVRNG